MLEEDRGVLRALLTEVNVLSLGVLIDEAPYVGLLAFAAAPDFKRLLIHASSLARHSKGLRDGAPFGALIHRPDTVSADPLQVPRVSVEGQVHPVEVGGASYELLRETYLAKFPTSQQVFLLGDFTLYALNVARGRYVAGFGRTYNLSPESLSEAVSGGSR